MKDPLIGRTIAQRYRLISCLGEGGMASVYLARHVVIERLSAIKLVRPALGGDPIYKERILREARAVNRINHPNIVEITDYGEADGLVYLVMEYVPGESLQKVIERGPLAWRRAANVGLQVASALGRAHEMGVIHRDLTPANILVVERKDGADLVKLTDFGVAKVVDATSLTTGSMAFGTPGYMAPEYRSFGALDPRSDLFSLGVVLYQAITGALPFAPRPMDARSAPLPRLGRMTDLAPDVPRFFDEVVMTLLAPDPDDRPRDGFEAFDLLSRVLDGEGGAGVAPVELDREGAVSGPRPEAPSEPFPPSASVRPGELSSRISRSTGSPASPSPGSAPEPSPRRRPGPHLSTAAVDRIGPICAAALSRLKVHLPHLGNAEDPSAGEEAAKLVSMVETIAALVAADGEALEVVEAGGRALRAELGRELDRFVREQSKSLGWAGTIAERTYLVEARRVSGEHPVEAVDAMVWEQAALEQEEDRAREQAAEMAVQVESYKAEIARHNERLEHEMLVVTARLEGRIAALRSLSLEAALALEEGGQRAGLSKEALWGDARPGE
jgi:eukaryotic-like serine/threonine-protein kinase